MVRRGLNPASAASNVSGVTLPGGPFLARAICFGAIWLWTIYAVGAEPPIDTALAAQHFAEAREIVEQDNGKLWGHSLAGPILLVDPATRRVVGSQSDRLDQLTRKDGVFVGKLPMNVLVANTAIEWAGVKWSMVLWPLPDDRLRRRILLGHELWHRIQDLIGFPSSGAANRHLDTRDGRFWVQMEWRALTEALKVTGQIRSAALNDALVFRAYRQSLFDQAREEERQMEMHEGLAEYTGIVLGGAPYIGQWIADHNLKEAATKPTFVRSFAYASGPAYAALLDQAGTDWRKKLNRTDDLGALLQSVLGLQLPRDLAPAAQARVQSYGGKELAETEAKRAEDREKLLARYRQKFIDGPVLVLPLQHMKMQFDPGELIPLEPRGTVYPSIKIVDVWGILTVSGGALLESDFSRITVTAPVHSGSSSVKGEGWTLELESGWELKAGARAGDQTIGKLTQ